MNPRIAITSTGLDDAKRDVWILCETRRQYAPRRTRALAALCDQLNATATRYPGTQLTLHYEIKDHPGTT